MAATAVLVGSFKHSMQHRLPVGLAASAKQVLKGHRAPFKLSAGYLSSVPEDYQNRPGPWDEEDLGSLLQANKRWAKRMRETNPKFFEDLKCHAPKILWIGCADARVPANEIIGEPPGSVFIHRNIANQVVNTDFNCMSVIQYAVEFLKVKHVIVCGHYDCGGIRAALTLRDHKPPLENWLRNIRDSYRIHRHELNAISDPVARQRRMVEINVVEQCINIFKTAAVQRRRVETHGLMKAGDPHIKFVEPRVHAFVYEPSVGIAQRLDVNFKDYFDELRQIYDLYRPTEDSADAQQTQTLWKSVAEDPLAKEPEAKADSTKA